MDADNFKQLVIDKLHTIYDPEIPVNIYDLGLIYEVNIDVDKNVVIIMTLTTPGCPVAHTFPGMIQNSVSEVDGVKTVEVQLVWDPPWTQERMSEVAKIELGMF